VAVAGPRWSPACARHSLRPALVLGPCLSHLNALRQVALSAPRRLSPARGCRRPAVFAGPPARLSICFNFQLPTDFGFNVCFPKKTGWRQAQASSRSRCVRVHSPRRNPCNQVQLEPPDSESADPGGPQPAADSDRCRRRSCEPAAAQRGRSRSDSDGRSRHAAGPNGPTGSSHSESPAPTSSSVGTRRGAPGGNGRPPHASAPGRRALARSDAARACGVRRARPLAPAGGMPLAVDVSTHPAPPLKKAWLKRWRGEAQRPLPGGTVHLVRGSNKWTGLFCWRDPVG
jgi:hypothetical protein